MIGLETVVAGGDDYEVLCTIPENRTTGFVQAAHQAGVRVAVIGTIVAGASSPRFVDQAGRDIVLKRLSYSHF